MNNDKKDKREKYNYSKDTVHKPENYTKDDLIDLPFNQAKRYEIGSTGIPYKKSRFEEIQKEEKNRGKVEVDEVEGKDKVEIEEAEAIEEIKEDGIIQDK